MLSEDGTTEYLDKTTKELLQDIVSENGLICYEIQDDKSVKCYGLHGKVIGVQLKCKDNENKEKTLSVVVKSALKSDALRAQVIVNDIYTREVFMYNVVFTAYKQFETEKKLVPTLFTPKFYKASLEDKNEILVLENLKESGYKMYSKTNAMDSKHVSLVLEKCAELHALGLALRDQNFERFKEITNSMDDVFTKFLEKGDFVKGIKIHCLKSLKSLREEVDTEAFKTYKDFINNIEEIYDDIRGAGSDEFSTVLHGDTWTTNLMFKYEDSNDSSRPTSLRFVDFQVARLGPPVLDIAFFFYLCSTKELIDHLEDYLKVYYNSLVAQLIKLGSNPCKIYPYKVLLQQWKKYSRFVLTFVLSITHLMLTEENELIDIKDLAEAGEKVADHFDYKIANLNLYYDRVRHIILHFVKNKFI